MDRRRALNNKKESEDINAELKNTASSMHHVGEKLLKDDNLTLIEMQQLANRLADREGYDTNQLVFKDVSFNFNSFSLENFKNEGKQLFIILSSETEAIAVFSLLEHSGKTFCLFKDFSNSQITQEIQAILEHQFNQSIEFKIHKNPNETHSEENTVVLVLKTLETMMTNSKPEKIKDFVENFTNDEKKFFEWVKIAVGNLKKELFYLVKEGYYKTFESFIDQLSKDTAFKAEIKTFINNIPLEEMSNFKSYQNLLKKFVELDDEEVEVDAAKMQNLVSQISEARKTAFDNIKKSPICQNKISDQKLDIQRKFPKQMEMFTKIFEPLAKSQVDDKLDKNLEEISKKLDLDYEKLKSFFNSGENEVNDESVDDSNVSKIDDIFTKNLFLEPKINNATDSQKPIEQLLTEISIEKSDFNVELLKKIYDEVISFSNLWEQKDAHEINRWAVLNKGRISSSEFPEALAIMDRANEIATQGQKLRDSQIISVLTFLLQRDKGQLSEIQTGEGKTIIVSVLAAIRALQGLAVDVITSNPVLASEGVKDRKLFYNLLGLCATTNNLDDDYKTGEKKCYKSDIVYGSIGNFQFDFLKDSFLEMQTRAKRPFECIILDEVDSMIIDNASHIAKLSEPFPGMESLKYVYIKIWQELYKAEESVIQEFQKQLETKSQELKIKTDQQEMSDDEAQNSYDKLRIDMENSIMQNIIEKVKQGNPTKIDIIPSHIQDFAENSLEKWINSAISAKYSYREDEQYVIRKDKDGEKVIQPVDYANTGITMKNTMWQYGLHQFLQLKHNLHLTSESLTSCFISNLGYINKYGAKIYGLTGTLGSQAERELLSSLYNVGFAKIPTYKEKQFSEIDGDIVGDESFDDKIADDAISKAGQGRSSLVICETIKDAKAIIESLKSKNHSRIRIFFDEDNAGVTEKAVKPGEVVIATNIAGRGTDLKTTPELEDNGGLHVCVVFLPCNKRVEDQAFGRTARQGNRGTAQIILKQSDVDKLKCRSYNLEDIKYIRDLKEMARIEEIRETKVLELKFQDELFELFSHLCRQLKRKEQSTDGYSYVLNDLKEFWAFWLDKKDYKGRELVDMSTEKEFDDFKSEADAVIKGKIKFNPYHSIQQAEHFILNDEFEKAEKALNHAIEISNNPEILHSAYLKLFEIALEKGDVFVDKCRKTVEDFFTSQGQNRTGIIKQTQKNF